MQWGCNSSLSLWIAIIDKAQVTKPKINKAKSLFKYAKAKDA